MRKLLFLTILFANAVLFAQQSNEDLIIIEQGTWNLGGSLAFNSNNFSSDFDDGDFTQTRDNRIISLFPRVGYTLSDNWVMGMILEYSLSKTDLETFNINSGNSTSEGQSEIVSFSPYLRKYFGIGKHLAIYLQGEVGFVKSWNEEINSDDERRTSSEEGFSTFIRPGISFFVSQNLAFESSIGRLGYFSFDLENEPNSGSERSGFEASINASNLLFGLSYFF